MKRTHYGSPNRILAILSVILLSACAPRPSDPLHEALEKAGHNRTELESVIEHYQTADPDSQKRAAAEFLIANMAGHYTIAPRDPAPYRDALRQIAAHSYAERQESHPGRTAHTLDSTLKKHPFQETRQWDVKHLSARVLITNIDSAFSRWRQTPWHSRYTFGDFCEWVLPYRTDHEAPDEDWRALALSTPCPGEDTLLQEDSILKLAIALINRIDMRYGTDILRYPLPMTYGEMQSVGEGACFELSDFATKTLRSRGIPAATDLVPAWGNRSSGHAWNTIVHPAERRRRFQKVG